MGDGLNKTIIMCVGWMVCCASQLYAFGDNHVVSDTLSVSPDSTDLSVSTDTIHAISTEAQIDSIPVDTISWQQMYLDSLRLDSLRQDSLRRDSLRMLCESQCVEVMTDAWKRTFPWNPVPDSMVLALTDSVVFMAEANAPYRRAVDSLMAQVRSVPYNESFSYAQPDYRLPLSVSGEIPYRSRKTVSGRLQQNNPWAEYDVTDYAKGWRQQLQTTQARNTEIYHYIAQHIQEVRLCRMNMIDIPFQRARVSNDRLLLGQHIELEAKQIEVAPIHENASRIKADKWHYRGFHTLQMMQTALSDNWYKGGENNMNISTDQKIVIKRYDEKHITSFETTLQLKLSAYYSKVDTVHPMRVNDNTFVLDTKYGYKAWKNWYYSSSLYAKTPIFEYYKSNSETVRSAFLSPLELNVGIGMDYKFNSKDKRVSYSLLLAPVSYNLKYVHSHQVDETSYGIEKNRRALNKYGSTLTSKLEWRITNDISWSSRLYIFTNYESVSGEFENTFNFAVSRFFSARLYLYPRFDDTVKKDHWQMKEEITIGFNYIW